MRNETFREVGYWGCFTAFILGLINIIICLIKSIKSYVSAPEGDFTDIISDTAEVSYSTLLYKISVGVLLFSFLLILISFLINTDGALKIIMLICKILQLGCIGMGLWGFFKLQDPARIKLSLIAFSVIEILVLILYLIDRDHRKTITRVAVFSILTLGSGLIFMIVTFLLLTLIMLKIVIFISSIFRAPEHRTAVVDLDGKVIGWLKRE